MDARALFKLDVDELTAYAIARSREETDADDVALYLQGGDPDQLFRRIGAGATLAGRLPLRVRLGDSEVIGPSYRDGKTRTFTRKHEVLRRSEVDAALCAPLIQAGRSFGVLCAVKNGRAFTTRAINAFAQLAHHVAEPLRQSIERAEANERAATTERLNGVTSALLGSHDEAVDLRNVIVDRACEMLGADLAILYAYDERADDLVVPPAIRGTLREGAWPQIKGPRHPVSLAQRLLRSPTPHFAPVAGEDWDLDAHIRGAHDSPPFPEREGIVSSAGIPLRVGDHTLGVLFLNYRVFFPFTHQQREAIALYARLAALALQNAASHRRQNRYVHQLKVLNDLGQRINAAPNAGVDDILPIIHTQTTKLMEAQNFYVAFYLADTDSVVFPYAVEHDRRVDGTHAAYARRRGVTALTETVLRTRRPLLIRKDVAGWMAAHDVAAVGDHCRSWLGVPLVMEKGVTGIIAVQSYTDENAYDEADRDLLQTIAAQVAPVLARLRALEELQRNQEEFELLGEATLAISAGTSVEARLDMIVGDAIRLFRAQGGKVYLVEPGRRQLVLKAVRGVPPLTLATGETLDFGEGLSGQVILEERAIFTNDYAHYPHHLPDQAHTFRSLIGVPLRLGAEQVCIGVLTIFVTEGERYFSERDCAKVQRFANYAALALRDADQRRSLQQQIERFQIITDITQAIGTSSDLPAYFQRIVEAIKAQLGCDQCTLFLRAEEDGQVYLRQHAVSDDAGAYRVQFRSDQGLAGRVLREGGAHVFHDVTAQPGFLAIDEKPYRFHSMLAAAIQIGDKKIGLITADASRNDAFSDADREWLEALSSNIATGIESTNAASTQQQLSTQLLGAMTGEKRGYDAGIQAILKQIVEKAIRLLQGSSSIIYVLSDDKREIVARACPPGKEHHHPPPRQEPGGGFAGITGEIIRTGAPIVIPDVRSDLRVTPQIGDLIRSLSAFPLKLDDDVIGVIYVDHTLPRTLTAIELRFMSMLADLAALAINKYQLVSRMARTRDSVRLVAGEALIQDWDVTLRTLLDGASASLGGDAICLFVYDAVQEQFEARHYLKGVRHPDAVARTMEDPSPDMAHFRLLEEAAPRLATDVLADPVLAGGFARREDIRSAAAVRLSVRTGGEDRTVGVLFINYRTPKHAFTREDREDIELFASLAAATIRSAQLYKKVNRIRETARRFANDNLKVSEHLDAKLDSIVNGVRETLGCHVVSVHRYLPEKGRFSRHYASAGEREKHPRQRSLLPRALFEVLEYDRLHTTDEAAYRDALLGPFTRRQGIRSVAALPLGDPDEKVGVLFVSYRNDHRFSEEERRDIQLFADQSAIAIRNSHLYQQRWREKNRYETLLKHSPNPIVAVDSRGRITYCNDNVEHILGYATEELQGMPVHDLYWGGREEARAINARLKQKKHINRQETFIRHRSGDRIPILLSAAVLPQPADGALTTVSIGILEDQRVVALRGRIRKFFDVVSELNQRREMPLILGDLFLRAFDLFSSCEAGCIFLRDDRVLRMVSEFQAPPALIEAPDIPFGTGLIGGVAAGGTPRILDLTAIDDDPIVPFSSRSRSAVVLPIAQEGQCLGVLYLESIVMNEFSLDDDLLPLLATQAAVAIERAQYHEVQTRWQKTSEQMFASSKAIVAAQIASSMLHEVKNLLHNISQTILLFRDMIKTEEGIRKPKPYFDLLEAVAMSVRQAARLANESQRFKDSLTAHRKPEYLNEVVGETLLQLESVLKKKKLGFETRLDPALDAPDAGTGTPVSIDRGLIVLVIINLVLNAVEASNERSKLVVATQRREHDVVFSVTDFGKGIAPEDMDTIFEPFFSRRKGTGVGLGLFVSKKIIMDQHGGYVDVESKPGKKTVFTVHLPLKTVRA